ncbi:MAG: hypothetical protein N838_25325 [Thiohalocapsa sp. PB-PSB1]|nr:MAG: hypothetical protein N838_25325 [Thiohalocapsa sp. PB-PSB1]
MLLTAEQWQALDFNPFRLPHLVKNAAEFSATALPDFDQFGANEPELDQPDQDKDVSQISEPWRLQLAEIWQGIPPIRLPAEIPPQFYELLLLSLPHQRRGSTSCVCGPFRLKQIFQERIDIARGSTLSISDRGAASTSLREDRLNTAKLINGCWDANWTSRSLEIPSAQTPAPAPAATPVDQTSAQKPITIGDPKQRKANKLKLWLGIGLALVVATGILLVPRVWRHTQLEKACIAWSQDFDNSQTRLDDTRTLLQRADELRKRDPDEQVCIDLTARSATLINLYRSRLAVIDGKLASSETDVKDTNRLNADLLALVAMPQLLNSSDNDRFLAASDRLYQQVAQWVGAADTSQALRERYAWLRLDEADNSLPRNPYLADIEAQVRALEQQEALQKLRTTTERVGSLDRAGMDKLRQLLGNFRTRYPNERKEDLASIIETAVLQFESDAHKKLKAVYQALKQRPTAQNLAAFEQAVDAYRQDMAPATEMTKRAGIDSEELLGQLKTDKDMVNVVVVQNAVGASAEIGILQGSGRCVRRGGFAPFEGAIVCVRLSRHPSSRPIPRHESSESRIDATTTLDGLSQSDDSATFSQGNASDKSNVLEFAQGLWRTFVGNGNSADDQYIVPLLELLRIDTWQSDDKRISLQAKVQWPSLDDYRR